MSVEDGFRRVLAARLPAGPAWAAWIDGTVAELAAVVPADPEKEALGRAAFAAVVASGADTDGARTWQEYFRPLVHPTWEDSVRADVEEAVRIAEDAS